MARLPALSFMSFCVYLMNKMNKMFFLAFLEYFEGLLIFMFSNLSNHDISLLYTFGLHT